MTDKDFKKPVRQFSSFKMPMKVEKTQVETNKIQTELVESDNKDYSPITAKSDVQEMAPAVSTVDLSDSIKSNKIEDELFEKRLEELEAQADQEIFLSKQSQSVAVSPVKQKRNKKRNKFILFFLLFTIIFSSLGFGLYQAGDRLAFWNDSKEATAEKEVGTFVAYQEGAITQNNIGGEKTVYNNEIFPDFELKSDSYEWSITESDKSRNENLKYDIIFKNLDLNIVFSFYTDNGGLRAGSVCLRDSDVEAIDENWSYEKRYNEVYEDHIGYYFIPSNNYTLPNSPDFDGRYNDYVEFISSYTDNVISREDASYCSSAQRVIKTKTTKPQSDTFNDQNQVLLRIFTPASNLTEENKVMINDLVKSIKY